MPAFKERPLSEIEKKLVDLASYNDILRLFSHRNILRNKNIFYALIKKYHITGNMCIIGNTQRKTAQALRVGSSSVARAMKGSR